MSNIHTHTHTMFSGIFLCVLADVNTGV